MSNVIEILDMIIEDMEADVKNFEGKPFTGKTLGELHGNLCATVQALATIIKQHINAAEVGSETETSERTLNVTKASSGAEL